MIDSFVLLTPVLLLAVIALLRFVGCQLVFDVEPVPLKIAEVGSGNQRRTTEFTGDFGTATFPVNVTANHLLIAAGASARGAGPPASITVTDTLGTSYTVLSAAFTNPDGSGERVWIAFGVAPSSGACTVTVNPAATGGQTSFSIDEFSFVDQDTPLDVDGGSFTGTTTTAQASLTTNTPGALLIGVLTHNDVKRTITRGPDYTQIGQSEITTGSQPHSAVFRVVEEEQSYTVDWSFDDMQQTWFIYTAAFKRASS